MSSYLRNLFGGSSANPAHGRPQPRRAQSYQHQHQHQHPSTGTQPFQPPSIYAPPFGQPLSKTSSRTSTRSSSGNSVRFADSPVDASFPVIPAIPGHHARPSRSRASSLTGHPSPALPPHVAHPLIYPSSRSSSQSSLNSYHSHPGVPGPQASPSSSKRRRPSLPNVSYSSAQVPVIPPTPPMPPRMSIPMQMTMHPLLAYSKRYPTIAYNVAHKPAPQTVTHPATHHPISPHTLSQPATSPGVSELTLTSPLLPWSIVVRPGAGASHPHPGNHPSTHPHPHPHVVTNLDLLTALHDALRTRTARAECEALGYGGSKMRKITAAYERRCARAGGGWERGLRRVDGLCERTVLVGVEVSRETMGMARLVFAEC